MGKIHIWTIGLMVAASVCTAQLTITEYPVATNQSSLAPNITKGPDGNLWFIEGNGIKIAKMTPAGVITGEFVIPSTGIYNNGSGTNSITSGPDGNLWFAEYFANKIGTITPAGQITEFPIPDSGLYGNGTFPLAITAGPDGNLWFTEYVANKIGRITTAGAITEFPVPSGGIYGASFGITAGPDGNLWFTECRCSTGASGPMNIGRITPAGVITEFPVTDGGAPYEITAGPDGNLWFTELLGNNIAKITPAGVITEFSIPSSGSEPVGVTAGPDGNLWFTELSANKIGRITPKGTITEYPVPTAGSGPEGITQGPDGNLWFVEDSAKQIGKASFLATCSYSVSPTGQSFTSAGGLGSFTVNTAPGCAWTTTPSASWITIFAPAIPRVCAPQCLGGGGFQGTATVSYAVTSNSDGPRSGSISVGGQTYAITQAGFGCTYSIGPTFASPSDTGGNVSVSVGAPGGCAWTAVSNASWLTVQSRASGSGGGVVVLHVAPNTGGPRSGTATIAGHTFSVTQGAGACGALDETSTLNLSPGGFQPGRAGSNLYHQQITITNFSGSAISGPLNYVLIGLPTQAGAGLTGGFPFTYCFSTTGTSIVLVSGGGLAPGQHITFGLDFVDPPFGGLLNYTPKILSGTPSR